MIRTGFSAQDVFNQEPPGSDLPEPACSSARKVSFHCCQCHEHYYLPKRSRLFLPLPTKRLPVSPPPLSPPPRHNDDPQRRRLLLIIIPSAAAAECEAGRRAPPGRGACVWSSRGLRSWRCFTDLRVGFLTVKRGTH